MSMNTDLQAFNSLSRDHRPIPLQAVLSGFIFLSTPSLGITKIVLLDHTEIEGTWAFQLPLSGSQEWEEEDDETTVTITFNSLSRDHFLPKDKLTLLWVNGFQLPLSGSPGDVCKVHDSG